MAIAKRTKAWKDKITPGKHYPLEEALTLVKEFAPTAGSVTRNYRVVNTAADLRALVERLERAGSFAFRVLVDRPSAMQASIVGLAFSTSPRDADYVPVGHHALGAVPSMPTINRLRQSTARIHQRRW